jgi:hypothetical protein
MPDQWRIEKRAADNQAKSAHGTKWNDWSPEDKGFNTEAFKDLSTEDYRRLKTLGLGPGQLSQGKADDPLRDNAFSNYWADGNYGDTTGIENIRRSSSNRGIWENAVQATGKFNIKNSNELMGFVSEIENYKAGNADFMKEGDLTQKDVWNLSENWNKAEPVADQPAPKAEPVAKKPEGSITESSHIKDAKERAVNFKNPSSSGAFNPAENNPHTFDKRPTESRLAQNYDFTGGASNLMSNVSSNKPPASTKPPEPTPKSPTSRSSTDTKQPYKKPFTDLVASSAGGLMGSFG